MKIPKELKIGGHVYRIVYPYIFQERGDCCGIHQYSDRSIRIQETDSGGTKRTDSGIRQILLHEIMHAIDCVFCMEQIGKEADKDHMIDGIAEGLTQLLSDNPELLNAFKIRGEK